MDKDWIAVQEVQNKDGKGVRTDWFIIVESWSGMSWTAAMNKIYSVISI